jgi:hypothetical protein
MRKYNKTAARKKVLLKYTKSDTFYDARKYYRVHSDAFKANRKKSSASEAAYKARERRQERKKNDPATNMLDKLQHCMVGAIKGNKKTKHLADWTEFRDGASVRSFWKSKGVKIAEHNKTWTVEHKIPCSAYDHLNPVDVKHCWSRANLEAIPLLQNQSKSFTIVDSKCIEVGSGYYPVAWNGSIPSKEQKQAWYASMQFV